MRVRSLRTSLGIKQADLAPVLGVSQPRYSQMENGAQWTAAHVDAACSALGCRAGDLMDEDPIAISGQERAVLAAFRAGDFKALMLAAVGGQKG